MELLRWLRLQWDRVLAVAAMAGGIVAVALAWAGASRTEFVAKQVPYAISGGLGGLVALMLGGTLWLSADLRDQWRALDRLEQELPGGVGREDGVPDAVATDMVLEDLCRRLATLEHGDARLPAEQGAGEPSAEQEVGEAGR